MGIGKLLQAEGEAEQIIAKAQAARGQKKENAKIRAEEELKKFREEQERKYQAEMADEENKAKSTTQSASDNKSELDQVETDYLANKDKTVKYIVDKVKEVNLELTSTQILALKSGQV